MPLNVINKRVDHKPLVSSAVSIYMSWLIFSSKRATVTMAPAKIAKSLYCPNLSLRLSLVGGTIQYFRRVHSLWMKLAFLAAGRVDSLKFLRSINTTNK